MKNILIGVMITFLSFFSISKQNTTSLAQSIGAGESTDLYTALELFERSENVEEFESVLTDSTKKQKNNNVMRTEVPEKEKTQAREMEKTQARDMEKTQVPEKKKTRVPEKERTQAREMEKTQSTIKKK